MYCSESVQCYIYNECAVSSVQCSVQYTVVVQFNMLNEFVV